MPELADIIIGCEDHWFLYKVIQAQLQNYTILHY